MNKTFRHSPARKSLPSSPHYQQQNRPKIPPNQHRHFPSSTSPSLPRPNFIIQLRPSTAAISSQEVKALLSKLSLSCEHVAFSPSGHLIPPLYFNQWVDTLNAMVGLWESRLNGVHCLKCFSYRRFSSAVLRHFHRYDWLYRMAKQRFFTELILHGV